ncbi:hypothetical protein BVRB_5g101370 [Beta vulgaris subsp. vulgaris]|nr:hypothetical protein BVRB_5g101370 [Beta vulgaris subsp. vulgaris]
MNSSFSNSFSSNGATVAGDAISWPIFSLGEIQILEIFLAVGAFFTIHSLRRKNRQGLPTWPFVGMLPSLIVGVRDNAYEYFTDVICSQKGTFQFKGPWLSNLNSLLTADPRNIEYLLKTKFSNFPKGGYYRSIMEDLLGDGIFNADNEMWHRQRKMVIMEFHSPRFRQLTVQSLLELVHNRLLPVLEESRQKSAAIDLQDVLLRLTFDNVCMIALGVDPGCLAPGLPDIPFARAFEQATEATAIRFVTPTSIWKLMRFLNLGPEKELKESIKGINKFAEQVIMTRKKEICNSQEDNTKNRSDLLAVLMRSKDETGQPFSDKFLKDLSVNLILAGRDTSSVALSWFFWLVDQHGEVEKKILDEISGIISQRETPIHPEVFQPEEIKKMEYLHAAISEALRLYPSVPMDHKEVMKEDVFPDGTLLKKGTKVVYSIYSMGRMETIWGKDCRQYKPERWIMDGRFINESAYKFTAFNGGPRLCLGKEFAYYQMKFTAASIIYRYRVKVTQNHLVEPKLALTMYMKHGLKVNLIPR